MKQPAFSLDTNCMIAAMCDWHERHEDAVAAIEERLDRREPLAIPAHALVEAYAVLTRLPPPHRLAPSDAWALIKANFVDEVTVASLDGAAHVTLLAHLAATGVRGGRSYDALIGACVAAAGAATLLTFNPKHFSPAPAGVAVREPGTPSPPSR